MKGIDVSHWNQVNDWNQVKSDGIEFVYLKATEGSSYVDPKVAEYYLGAKKAGLKVGFYHFARPIDESNTLSEARHFINTVRNMPADLPYVYDIETTGAGLKAEQLTKLAGLWLETVRMSLGMVMIYSYSYFQKNYLLESLTKYPLWIAHYDVSEPSFSRWDEYTCWQYTEKGSVKGIQGNVDLDDGKGLKAVAEQKKDYEGHWAKESIEKAIKSGVMKGHTDGTWGPNEPVTRGQLAVILDRLGLLDQ
ncbi:GH25 family lysozyme [Falsibacillus pallidus]|uniref:GH25 family lysozyme n=1 Tax=Falsibacillus pallidus TaxID=493781 RepID=UPI003D96D2EF